MGEALCVAGTWKTSGRMKPVINPFNGEEVFQVSQAESSDIEAALDASTKAFRSRSLDPTYERSALLQRASAILSDRKEEFSQLITRETGKPISFSRLEVDRAILTLSLSSEESKRIEGALLPLDLVPSSRGKEAIVKRFPIGPILAITPFNFPLNLVAHKLGPAFATGCPVILKPSSNAPVTSLRFAALLYDAGLPRGYLSVLPCSGDEISQVVEDERVKLVTFTGSPAVGWPLKSRAGKKRVVLELGGNAAVIVHHDADPSKAAERIVLGGFGNAGQSCISVQRVFAHKSVFESLKDALVRESRKIHVGDPREEKTIVGPMITEDAARKVETWVSAALKRGATMVYGGGRKGAVLSPIILAGVPEDEPVMCNEVFAPVLVLQHYETEEEVIGEVNNSRFGLQAGLFTNDARFIFRAFRELEVGGLIINDVSSYRMDSMPYGGVKDSGFGREGVRYAMEEMTELKLMAVSW